MSFDFPNSPTEGTVYAPAGGPVYTYTGGVWRMQGELPGFLAWPAGIEVSYFGGTLPAGTLFCIGQAVSRTTYAALFAAIGTAFGAGDGSTTFALPDMRGRLTAGLENMGGGAPTNRLSTIMNSTTMGSAGGASHHFLTLAEIPGHTHVSTQNAVQVLDYNSAAKSRADLAGGSTLGGTVLNASATGSSGSSGYHLNTQPTIVTNKLITTGGV